MPTRRSGSAEIVDYHAMGVTPVLLAASLAAGAIVALGPTLAASVRRRRRDLALLKALGFTKAQLSASVAVHSTVVAIIGLLFGLPLGIVLGRLLWVLFARGLDAVPAPTVPMLSLVLVAIGALVLVNLAAAIPGRIAARTAHGAASPRGMRWALPFGTPNPAWLAPAKTWAAVIKSVRRIAQALAVHDLKS